MDNYVYPSKLYKMTLYVADINHQGVEQWRIKELVSSEFDASVHIENFESVPIEWNDDIDINRTDATKEMYDRYFE